MLRWIRALRLIQTQDERMQAQTVLVLSIIAEFGPMRMSQVRDDAGISQASVSRNCAALGKIHRKGAPGLGLIKAEEDPMDRKHKIVSLTPKGEAFIDTLRDILEDRGERSDNEYH